jgi:hypothetical protein
MQDGADRNPRGEASGPDPVSSTPSPSGPNPGLAPIADAGAAAAAVSEAADVPSHGGTMTFQSLGAAGWYPSSRDPASGTCDAYKNGQCCMAKHTLPDAGIAPWDEELILTLRGPMLVKRIAVYQPDPADKNAWTRVSQWNDATPSAGEHIAFQGDGASSDGAGFPGSVGNKCLIDVSTDRNFPCGPGSLPYCAANSLSHRYGWEGSKLILLLASMPHFGSAPLAAVKHCSTDPKDNWYDAPWIGLSHGELIRSGKFGGCNCYSKDPAHWELADGCGQFNVFETVNDNNAYRNLDLFNTNFFSYAGYVGEGPCGSKCDVSTLDPAVDLISKSTAREAQAAVATPQKASNTTFRRPSDGYRWFVLLLDSQTRTVQLALAHPGNLPMPLATVTGTSVTAALPAKVGRSAIDGLIAMRLPGQPSTSLFRK